MMFMLQGRNRYIISITFLVIFSLLLCGGVAAGEETQHAVSETVHPAGDTVAAEGGHGGADRSADLFDLLYRFINFTLMIIILVIVIRKSPVKGFFTTRGNEIQQRLEDLKKEKEEAESRYLDVEKQLKDFEARRKDIIEEFRKEGLAEKEKIILDAKDRVDKIIEQSEVTIREEIQSARDRLKQEMVDIAAQRAQEIIAEEMDEKDQDNLVNEFIERVGKIH